MRIFALLAALWAGGAHAACQDERAFVLQALSGNGWTTEQEGGLTDDRGTCTLIGLVLVESKLALDVGSLVWRLEGLENLADGAGRVSLVATLDNLRMVPRVGDPWLSYMLAQQNRRSFIDGTLHATWDLDEGSLEAGFNLDLPGDNEFGADVRTFGMTPDLLSGNIGDYSTVQIDYVAMKITNYGIADALLLSPMIGAMSRSPGTPETVVEATKSEAIAIVEDMPDTLFELDSKDALIRLIADAPVPWGSLFVSLSADPPLPVSRLLPFSSAPNPLAEDALLAAFPGASFLISYVPAAD